MAKPAPIPLAAYAVRLPPASAGDVGHLDRDEFAEHLLADLDRRPGVEGGWGVLRTAIFGLLTFGIAPALAWAFAHRDRVADDRRALAGAADWFRFHSLHPEAGRLRDAAEGLYARPFLSVLPVVCCVGVVVFFLTSFAHRPTLRQLRQATTSYPVADRIELVRGGEIADLDLRDRRYAVWAGGLSAAYLALWLAARSHTASLNRFSAAFERFGEVERLPLRNRRTRFIPVVRWWVGGALLVYVFGAAWAPAAMLAAAARYRVAASTTARVRADVMAGIQQLRLRRARAMRSLPTVTCARDRCGAPLPAGARFCRRCGSAVAQGSTA